MSASKKHRREEQNTHIKIKHPKIKTWIQKTHETNKQQKTDTYKHEQQITQIREKEWRYWKEHKYLHGDQQNLLLYGEYLQSHFYTHTHIEQKQDLVKKLFRRRKTTHGENQLKRQG